MFSDSIVYDLYLYKIELIPCQASQEPKLNFNSLQNVKQWQIFKFNSNSGNFKMQASYLFQNQEEEKCDTLSK